MFRPRHFIGLTIFFLLASCKNDNRYIYAIKDFRVSLRPYLTKIVSNGIVMHYDSSLSHMATDIELMQLSISEHPVLRSSALREMLKRESFNHFDVVMRHLDDTATVATYAGEFGIYYRKVSDDILLEAKWKTNEDKSKTINEVITRHNYLQSAYTILKQIEPQEKYYSFIKTMATRVRKDNRENGEQGFRETEYALYGLAKFKKKDDVKIICKQLLENTNRISELSFTLLKEFPDTSYLQVFEKYYQCNFYYKICNYPNNDNAVDFIKSIVIYNNQKSAKILESILTRVQSLDCPAETDHLKYELTYAIWNNECEAYSKLRKQLEARYRGYEKNKIEAYSFEHIELPEVEGEEKIVWWK